jgi:hypothetical protein
MKMVVWGELWLGKPAGGHPRCVLRVKMGFFGVFCYKNGAFGGVLL